MGRQLDLLERKYLQKMTDISANKTHATHSSFIER